MARYKSVVGCYMFLEDALQTVQLLKENGYTRSDIFVVANEIVRDSLSDTLGVRIDTKLNQQEGEHVDNRSMWEHVEDAVIVDACDTDRREQPHYDPDTDLLFAYRDAIAAGQIVVLVEKEREETP